MVKGCDRMLGETVGSLLGLGYSYLGAADQRGKILHIQTFFSFSVSLSRAKDKLKALSKCSVK